jgi:hypothetical protein
LGGFVPIQLNKLRVVNVTAKRIFYRLKIRPMPIACQLHPFCKPGLEIVNKPVGVFRSPGKK